MMRQPVSRVSSEAPSTRIGGDSFDLFVKPQNETVTELQSRLLDEAKARSISKAIDDQLKAERQTIHKKKAVKLLLLGQAESGKSTTLRQFQRIYAPSAFRRERILWSKIIQLNIVRSVCTLLDSLFEAARAYSYKTGQTQLEECTIVSPEIWAACTRLLSLKALQEQLISELACSSDEDEPTRLGTSDFGSISENATLRPPSRAKRTEEFFIKTGAALKNLQQRNNHRPTSADAVVQEQSKSPAQQIINACAKDIERVWRDPCVRAVLEDNKLTLEDRPGFFLDDIERVAMIGYTPTDDDVLKARLKTIGVVEHVVEMEAPVGHDVGSDWRLIDVGGAKTQRAAWIPYFDDVNAILFLAPISEFNQVLSEDKRVNRLEDSIRLWQEVCANGVLKDVEIILFLNKCDILGRKLRAGVSLAKYVRSYGDRENDLSTASKFFRSKFGALQREKSPVPRKYYSYFTSIIDTQTTAGILSSGLMNTQYPPQTMYGQYQQPQQSSPQSANPAAFFGQPQQQQQMQKPLYPGQFNSTVNPAQILGGASPAPGGMNGVANLNPSNLNLMQSRGMTYNMMTNQSPLNVYNAAQERARLAAAQQQRPGGAGVNPQMPVLQQAPSTPTQTPQAPPFHQPTPPQSGQPDLPHTPQMQAQPPQVSAQQGGPQVPQSMPQVPATMLPFSNMPARQNAANPAMTVQRPPSRQFENGASPSAVGAYGSPRIPNGTIPHAPGVSSRVPVPAAAAVPPHIQPSAPMGYPGRPIPQGGRMISVPIPKPGEPIMNGATGGRQLPPANGVLPPMFPPTSQAASLPIAATTVTTEVPLASSLQDIPELSPEEIENVKRWRESDKEYKEIFDGTRMRMGLEARDTFARPMWWEVTMPSNRPKEVFSLQYPRKARKSKRTGFKPPGRIGKEQSNKPEMLVPIRLEFDVDHHKMRDSLVWNLNDPVVTPDIFAQSVVDDYSLPSHYLPLISKSIQEQLSEYQAHAIFPDPYAYEGSDAGQGKMNEDDELWWKRFREKRSRKRRKLSKFDERVAALATRPSKDLEDSMRILIKLDVIVGSLKLEDQFEWDLENPDADPEGFSEVYCMDLGLGGEFKTAISHLIREQVAAHQRSLFLVGHQYDGTAVPDEDLRAAFLPNLEQAARPLTEVQNYTPLLSYLSDGETDRLEKERDKEMTKRRKRNIRNRRGVALPDREPIRTCRTPALGFPEVDQSAANQVSSTLAPLSRRAAAAAASIAIANVAAEENGTTPFSAPSAPLNGVVGATNIAGKDKKSKGHFKAPSLPPSVLTARSKVMAPTLSTAAAIDPAVAAQEESQSARFDARAAKAVSAKLAREREREAKDREFADGQHANMINGIWHCSNCGIPEPIAVGRRKGPLGDKSQCGACGKFWHQYRKPRQVEYNTSAQWHLDQQKKADGGRGAPKKRGAPGRQAAAPVAAPAAAPAAPATRIDSPQVVLPPIPVGLHGATEASPGPRGPSPLSSSTESPTLSRTTNGHEIITAEVTTGSTQEAVGVSVPPEVEAAPTQVLSTQSPPAWLSTALREMQSRYPDDRILLKRVQENWRIKCLDCPGKLYTPGPGETLSNYEIHLKNRLHRLKVAERLGIAIQPTTPTAAPQSQG